MTKKKTKTTKVQKYTGVKVKDGIEKKTHNLYKKPKRKKPKYDFEEGIYVGMLGGFLLVLQNGMAKAFSGMYTTQVSIYKAKAMIIELVHNYSYGPSEISDIMKSTGVENPEFMLEFVLTEGKPKERICEEKDCPVILTPSTMIKNFKCSQHQEDKNE